MKQRFASAQTTAQRYWRNVRFTLSSSWRVSRSLFVIKLLFYVAQGLLPILLAFLAGRLIDSIVQGVANHGDITKSIWLVLAAAGVGFVYGQSQRIDDFFDRKFGILYELHMNELFQKHFAALDHSHYESADFNKLVNKIQQNFGRVYRFNNEIFYTFANIVQLVGSGITLLFLNPLVTLMLVVGILPQLRVQMRSAKERWRFWDKADADWRLRWNIRNSLMDTDSIGEIKIFQLPNYLHAMWKRFFVRTEELYLDMERRIRNQQFGASFAETSVQILIDLWLLSRVFRVAGFTIGRFEFYRRIIQDFYNSMSRLVVGLQTLNEVGLYMGDFLDFMDLKPNIVIPERPKKLPVKKIPKIEFKNVSFRYPKSRRYVLKNLNLTINPGEDVAIVGENGAGKTTLIKLLMRFYDVTDGAILLNGIDIKEIELDSLYEHVGALFQRFNTYSYFRARRSIGVGNTKQVDNLPAIKRAAVKAGADKFINKLPQAYDTVLSKVYEEGTDLSGGEWQRIALARTFFRNAGILILDEPTAAIDAKAEYEIFNKIKQTQKDKTTIIISHRFSTVRNAKKILVIERGEVVEQGSHNQLMKIKDGIYQHMFNLQAEGYR